MNKPQDNDKWAELLKTQKSLTEWLEDISHAQTTTIRQEDNDKRERLRVLNEVIGLPFDRPTQFKATDLSKETKKFKEFLKEHKDELCALRLIPLSPELPKIRMRGKTVAAVFEWFKEQDIDPNLYRADFMPHAVQNKWGTIFIVNKHGIQGEIVSGSHHQLTQGFHDGKKPILFKFDYETWQLSEDSKEVEKYLKKLVSNIKVTDKKKRDALEEKLGTTFTKDYINGYFETVDSEAGLWYVDYAPTLGKMYGDVDLQIQNTTAEESVINGRTGSGGEAEGVVKIVMPNELDLPFEDGSILVCPVTTPEYVPLMMKASAIVTDQGGILSHAAIVARELNKPCVVSTGTATTILSNGQIVRVDAHNGTIYIID